MAVVGDTRISVRGTDICYIFKQEHELVWYTCKLTVLGSKFWVIISRSEFHYGLSCRALASVWDYTQYLSTENVVCGAVFSTVFSKISVSSHSLPLLNHNVKQPLLKYDLL